MTDENDSRSPAYLCQTCASSLVQPLEWERQHDDLWSVEMRCPECHSHWEALLDQEEVNQYSYHMEHGFQCLLESLEQMDHEAFRGECESFIAAVWSDNVYPMDF